MIVSKNVSKNLNVKKLNKAFCCCVCSHEYAQATEEACLSCPPLWEKEVLVGPMKLPMATPVSRSGADQRWADHPEACDCTFPGSLLELHLGPTEGQACGHTEEEGNCQRPDARESDLGEKDEDPVQASQEMQGI